MTDRHPIPTRDPKERSRDFEEVALGYDEETAVSEASRCLHCKNRPCVEGCPVGVHIPEFIAQIEKRNIEEANSMIRETSSLPAVCGRVCSQEKQCEARCTRGIKGQPVAIGALERFVADHAEGGSQKHIEKNGKRIAVIGSGPAGLSCAGELAGRGYDVTVYEALHVAGGVLMYGIPEFRLPKDIVRREIEALRAIGVHFVLDAVAGRAFTAEDLLAEGYSAVFLGTGAGLPRFMGIKGENALGVFSANEYLTRVNLMKAYEEDAETPVVRGERVVVVGGGNVAMDAARCARRIGAEVTVVYRRSREELPARKEEAEHAEEEGIIFLFLTNPVEILTDEGRACGVLCAEMALGEPDASGRRRPVDTGKRKEVPADVVIMALGTPPNPLAVRAADVEHRPHGEIVADEDGRTSVKGIYAGGDAVTGAATVILAMGAGRRAAQAIDEDLKKA